MESMYFLAFQGYEIFTDDELSDAANVNLTKTITFDTPTVMNSFKMIVIKFVTNPSCRMEVYGHNYTII